MKCRMCGYEFDENEIPNRGCSGCGKHGCHSVHCPNCGFGNSPELDQEFDFIIKLKDKIKNRKKATHYLLAFIISAHVSLTLIFSVLTFKPDSFKLYSISVVIGVLK